MDEEEELVARLGGKHRIGYVLEESGSRSRRSGSRAGSRAGSRSRSRSKSKTKSRFDRSMANQSIGSTTNQINSDLLAKDIQTSSHTFSSQNMTKTNSNSNKVLISNYAPKDGTTILGRHSTNPFVKVSQLSPQISAL